MGVRVKALPVWPAAVSIDALSGQNLAGEES
jgi:hypothetical protein